MPATLVICFILLSYINFGSTYTYFGHRKGYSAVPPNIPKTAFVIHLSSNNIQTITEYDFMGFAALHTVNLKDNSIGNISQNSFQGSPVRKLYLSNNPLRVFPNLVNLKHNLTYLELSSCSITNMSANFVIDYDKLDTLILDSNPIESLPNMTKFKDKLVKLYLSNCALTVIPSLYFEGFSALRSLNLAENKFVNFTAFAFKGLHSLKYLDLANNKLLENIDPEAFPGLIQLISFNMHYVDLLKTAPILKNSTKLLTLRISKTKFEVLPTDFMTHMQGELISYLSGYFSLKLHSFLLTSTNA